MKKVENGNQKVISVKTASNGTENLYLDGKRISRRDAGRLVTEYYHHAKATHNWVVNYDLYIDIKVAPQLCYNDFSQVILFDGEIENVMVQVNQTGNRNEFVPANNEKLEEEILEENVVSEDAQTIAVAAEIENAECADAESNEEPAEVEIETVETAENDELEIAKFEVGKVYFTNYYTDKMYFRVVKRTSKTITLEDIVNNKVQRKIEVHTEFPSPIQYFDIPSYTEIVTGLVKGIGDKTGHILYACNAATENDFETAKNERANWLIEESLEEYAVSTDAQEVAIVAEENNASAVVKTENNESEMTLQTPKNIAEELVKKLLENVKTLSSIHTESENSYEVFDVFNKQASVTFEEVDDITDEEFGAVFNDLYENAKKYFAEKAVEDDGSNDDADDEEYTPEVEVENFDDADDELADDYIIVNEFKFAEELLEIADEKYRSTATPIGKPCVPSDTVIKYVADTKYFYKKVMEAAQKEGYKYVARVGYFEGETVKSPYKYCKTMEEAVEYIKQNYQVECDTSVKLYSDGKTRFEIQEFSFGIDPYEDYINIYDKAEINTDELEELVEIYDGKSKENSVVIPPLVEGATYIMNYGLNERDFTNYKRFTIKKLTDKTVTYEFNGKMHHAKRRIVTYEYSPLLGVEHFYITINGICYGACYATGRLFTVKLDNEIRELPMSVIADACTNKSVGAAKKISSDLPDDVIKWVLHKSYRDVA